ncbi:MAG: GNAT family N-acetyltransferase, partial [Clostridia bacterium]|nr:GNAT family N-acetyltransferase [Clostridia bacterium]
FCKHMKELGFKDESKWIERQFVIPDEPYERVVAISEKLKKKLDVTELADIMSVKKILKNYGSAFFDTLNLAYGDLDGYVPIVGKAQDNVLKQFATIVNLKYISILADKEGRVAAFGIVLPSIADALIKHRGRLLPFGFIDVLKSMHDPKELEMALIAVHPEYKNTGINSIVITRIMKNVVQNRISHIESNPMLETNYNIQMQWKFAANDIIKKRQTYIKEIN